MTTYGAIIAAGGAGLRMGLDRPKQFTALAGTPLLIHTLRAFAAVASLKSLVIVAPAAWLRETEELLARHLPGLKALVVAGGATRQASVAAGLAALPPEIDVVAVHDGARPLVTPALIEACLAAAANSGAAIAAVEVQDTLKQADDHRRIKGTIERRGLWQAQTPQAARRELLQAALAAASRDGFSGTDEAALLERIGCPVTLVAGSTTNLKITRPDDLQIAEALLMHQGGRMRIGHGYDAHRLTSGRALVLGGVTIPHPLGLLGHSDADVLTHALCDAILGALGRDDLGAHFPDSDPRFKDILSLKLLAEVMNLAAGDGFTLTNADLTVIAQAPKLAPHRRAMRAKLAEICRVEPERINIKATTTENLGFSGRGEGIAAHAVVILQARSS